MQTLNTTQLEGIKDVTAELGAPVPKDTKSYLLSLKHEMAQLGDNFLNQTWGPSSNTEPKPNTQPLHMSLYTKLRNWTTNLNYSMSNSSQKLEEAVSSIILGKPMSTSGNEEVKKLISQILWFSYRDKFPPLLEQTFQQAYTCDRGWGCMLRCGQMMLGEALRRHFSFTKKLEKGAYTENVSKEIISLFLDTVNDASFSPFSIQQISAMAYDYFEIKPGVWYKPSNIMVSLSKLNDHYHHPDLKTLKMCIFLDGTVFEDQILNLAYKNPIVQKEPENKQEEDSENKQVPNGEETKGDCPVEEKKENEEEKKEEEKEEQPAIDDSREWDNQVLVFIATKTGLDEHNEAYLPTIFKLLSFRQSIGMLGGRGSKAFYFIGTQGKKLLYFDPHYVQDAPTFTDLDEAYKTYFLEKCFQINVKDIDTSVGFGFYLKNKEEFDLFKASLSKAIKEDSNFLVGLEKTTPPLNLHCADAAEYSDDHSFEIIE